MSKDKLKILVVPANEGGCSYYRAIMPFQKLQQHCSDEVEVRINQNPLNWSPETNSYLEAHEDMDWCDIMMTQNISNFGPLFMVELFKKAKETNCYIHYDTDDLLTEIYPGHRLYEVYKERDLSELTATLYNNADLVSVTQKKFADRIAKDVLGTLVVIKNAIDFDLPCWNLAKRYRTSKKEPCKIGWVGGIHHEQDVKQVPGLGISVNAKVGPENVRWGFYGRPPIGEEGPDDWQQKVWDEYTRILVGPQKHKNWAVFQAMPTDRYGSMYLNIDVAIAPLEWNNFNDSKSEIKLMEAGRYGIPLIATDCGAYDEVLKDGVTGYLISRENKRSDWTKAIAKCVKDPKHTRQMGENLKKIVNERYNINTVVHHRLELYNQLLKRD
jgi:glycosyltransferase involved in cell wall biosynthesis